MNILVIGASGRVGRQLVKQLLEQNHQVTGTSRENENLFQHDNYSHLALDLTASKDDIADKIGSNFDAVYFTAGSGGKAVAEVDLHGAVKTMQAAEHLGISRYIMLSTVFSLDTSKWSLPGINELKEYYIAKHYADHWLMRDTKLEYTIIQAGALKEREPTGKIAVNEASAGENAIKDVAHTLTAVLNEQRTFKEVFSIQNGDTDIEKAISQIA